MDLHEPADTFAKERFKPFPLAFVHQAQGSSREMIGVRKPVLELHEVKFLTPDDAVVPYVLFALRAPSNDLGKPFLMKRLGMYPILEREMVFASQGNLSTTLEELSLVVGIDKTSNRSLRMDLLDVWGDVIPVIPRKEGVVTTVDVWHMGVDKRTVDFSFFDLAFGTHHTIRSDLKRISTSNPEISFPGQDVSRDDLNHAGEMVGLLARTYQDSEALVSDYGKRGNLLPLTF